MPGQVGARCLGDRHWPATDGLDGRAPVRRERYGDAAAASPVLEGPASDASAATTIATGASGAGADVVARLRHGSSTSVAQLQRRVRTGAQHLGAERGGVAGHVQDHGAAGECERNDAGRAHSDRRRRDADAGAGGRAAIQGERGHRKVAVVIPADRSGPFHHQPSGQLYLQPDNEDRHAERGHRDSGAPEVRFDYGQRIVGKRRDGSSGARQPQSDRPRKRETGNAAERLADRPGGRFHKDPGLHDQHQYASRRHRPIQDQQPDRQRELQIQIYRLGYYGGDGATLVTT